MLVVAADDGVMPQTRESISHARAAGGADRCSREQDRPARRLGSRQDGAAQEGLQPEDWGGSTQFAAVSARERQNLDELLEKVLLVADAELELMANPRPRRPARSSSPA